MVTPAHPVVVPNLTTRPNQRTLTDTSMANFAAVTDKLHTYHHVFKIRYLIRIRVSVINALTQLGIPLYCIKRHVLPYIGLPFPEFTLYKCYKLVEPTGLRVVVRTLPDNSTVAITIDRLNQGYYSVGLQIYDATRQLTRVQTLGSSYRIRNLANSISYCYCYYNNQDVSMIKELVWKPTLKLLRV
jgi:hypothetical protein